MRAILPLAFMAVVGCKQGVGERCQVNSDCQDGLVCVIPAGVPASEGGTCQSQGGAVDAAIDLTASVDAALAEDAGDLATLDSTVLDLSPIPDLAPTPDLTLD